MNPKRIKNTYKDKAELLFLYRSFCCCEEDRRSGDKHRERSRLYNILCFMLQQTSLSVERLNGCMWRTMASFCLPCGKSSGQVFYKNVCILSCRRKFSLQVHVMVRLEKGEPCLAMRLLCNPLVPPSL